MAADYKKYDFKIFESLINIRSELTRFDGIPEVNRIITHIDEIKEQVKSKKIRVAVVGEFKRGKSSFINALLGSEILPADIEPTTAAVNRITYGSVPKAYIRFKDKSVTEVDVSELSFYITKLTSESVQNAQRIEEAVVEYPSAFCRNYVDIIDTPGMNDEDDMSLITLNELRNIDLAVAVLSATIPVSETEGEFLARIVESEGINDIVIVITHIDCIRREDDRKRIAAAMTARIKEKVMENLRRNYPPDSEVFEKYERIFNKLNVFAVSSADALDAMKFNNSELLERSGITEVNRMLPQIIYKNQNNNAILNAVKEMKKIREKYAYIEESFNRENSARCASIDSAEQEAMNIAESIEQINWQYPERKIEQTLREISAGIALMFDKWTKLRKPAPRRIRRKIRKQRKEVLRFMTVYMNYCFYNDALNDAYRYIYDTADSHLKSIERLSEKYGFMHDIDKAISEERARLELKVSSAQPRYRCKWKYDPTPRAVICCPESREQIYGYLSEAVFQSVAETSGKMCGDLRSYACKGADYMVRGGFSAGLKQRLKEYFAGLREENRRSWNEFNEKKLSIGNNIDSAVRSAEEAEREMLAADRDNR